MVFCVANTDNQLQDAIVHILLLEDWVLSVVAQGYWRLFLCLECFFNQPFAKGEAEAGQGDRPLISNPNPRKRASEVVFELPWAPIRCTKGQLY